MNDRSYYQEFEATIIGRIRARIVYARLDARCKLMAEANGVVMVGANYKAREIAMKVLDDYIKDSTKEKRIEIFKHLYRKKARGNPHPRAAEIKGRKSLLELLCEDVVFDLVKKNKLAEFLAKLNSPSQ